MIDVLIIGGGIAGIETACSLQDLGYETVIVEKDKVDFGTPKEDAKVKTIS